MGVDHFSLQLLEAISVDIENKVFGIIDTFFQENQDKNNISILKSEVVHEILISDDKKMKRKLMKKFIKAISVEEKGKSVIGMEFIVNEELFNFLNIKYTVRNAKMAKVMMDKLNCSLGNFVYEKDYQLKPGFENKREEKL